MPPARPEAGTQRGVPVVATQHVPPLTDLTCVARRWRMARGCLCLALAPNVGSRLLLQPESPLRRKACSMSSLLCMRGGPLGVRPQTGGKKKRAFRRCPARLDADGVYVRGEKAEDGAWTAVPCSFAKCQQTSATATRFTTVEKACSTSSLSRMLGVQHELVAPQCGQGRDSLFITQTHKQRTSPVVATRYIPTTMDFTCVARSGRMAFGRPYLSLAPRVCSRLLLLPNSPHGKWRAAL